jgi:hypothetical protein
MKTSTTLLLAIGFASHAAWAQSQDLQAPDSATWPRAGTESSGMSGSSGSSGAMQSEAGMEFNHAPAAMPLPQEQTQNDVAYLCGGVGEEEASYMKQQAHNYDLALTFATRTGAYLADVDVNIRNAKGDDVLQANCDGPMLLVNLPKSGTYRIRAETSGYSLNRTAKVTAGRNKAQHAARVAMVWPNDAGGTGAPATASGDSGTGSRGAGGDNSGGSNVGTGGIGDSSSWRDHRSPMQPREEGSAR